ncbi:hypothetical protein AALP_AAs61696U000100 [Arabis alpina]|uniref:Leucine-rich repeat-containing N-terminal plant-type domain-containing protein n=1 Tax=Arabis alpina TaxID=50452 RepID=A0A087G0K3_ARAAL|nr:hypothetical protein AALP_AAs61696U000100 [Arabis alpina]
MDKTTTLLFFLFTLLFTSSLSNDLCHKGDLKTVLKIKKSLSRHNNLLPWYPEILCRYDPAGKNHVTSLTISEAPISGQIPPEVGDLPYLEYLVFTQLPNLTGPIQPTIAKLKKLQVLELSWTKLTGPIPDFLGQLKELTHIFLGKNKLTGPIPESFGSFLGNVPELYLWNNQLSGSIPKSLGNLNFSLIDFSENKLQVRSLQG